MKVYDKVKQLLADFPELRDSDKKLMFAVWKDQGVVTDFGYGELGMTNRNFFSKAIEPETIRRCRQKVQELNEELRGTYYKSGLRKDKEETKGTFIYQEEI